MCLLLLQIIMSLILRLLPMMTKVLFIQSLSVAFFSSFCSERVGLWIGLVTLCLALLEIYLNWEKWALIVLSISGFCRIVSYLLWLSCFTPYRQTLLHLIGHEVWFCNDWIQSVSASARVNLKAHSPFFFSFSSAVLFTLIILDLFFCIIFTRAFVLHF